MGQTGAGKTSLINQFITSEYRNAFADELEEVGGSNTVSVNIGGYECDLTFVETNSDDVRPAVRSQKSAQRTPTIGALYQTNSKIYII